MKSTGITRKIDELGRIVLPIEIRRNLNMEEKDSLEIFVDGDYILLKKEGRACIKCKSLDNLKELRENVFICEKCIEEIK